MGARASVKIVPVENLRIECLPLFTQQAFLSLYNESFLAYPDWYLAGGTALALQVGHRQSEDLDFFTQRDTFDVLNLERKLFITRKWKTTLQDEGTLYGIFDKAKVSFIAYPFFVPSKKLLKCGEITFLTLDDIAAMKIIAISQRGRKRDFLDMYWYCDNGGSLSGAIMNAIQQYPGINHQLPHFLKSLVYFENAEQDPMPELFFKATWKEIRTYFEREVPKITKELLQLE